MNKQQQNLFDFEDILYSLVENSFLLKEYHELEYKSAKNGFPQEFWKTYSAFANTNTGVILLGIGEKNGNVQIEGLNNEQIEKYKKQFWNDCNNPNTINRNLLTNNDVKVLNFNDKKLLVFRIPFASRTEKPVFLTRNPFGNTYKRNHEGDYRCTDEEVKRIFADSSTELKKDSLILEHYGFADLDPTSIQQFRQLFISSRPGHPWHILTDLELLEKLGGYRKDRKTNTEGLTLAGLLMFGKDQSIREQEALPGYFPDFREKLVTEPKIRWTDRIYPDGSWECNLLQFYLKVWPKLSSTLPKPFQLEHDKRIDETPTHIALREAFVNALVHTDYSLSGNIVIELNTEKFVFSNPGTLLVSLQQYYMGGISECRNPSLQLMFMLIGRAEKAGSGVDKIISGWLESHWRRPYLELESQPDKVKLTLPMFSVIPDTVLNQLNAFFENISNLTPNELTALAICMIEGSISNRRLQYVLNLHSTDITALLKKLCVECYLMSDNNRRWTTYKLNEKVDTSDRKVDTSDRKVDTSDRKVDTSDRKVDTSDRKVDTSDRKVDTSDRKVDTSDRKVDTSDRKVDTSDRKVDTSDRKVDTSDRKVDTSDRKVDTSDRKVDTSDRKVDTSDRKVDTSDRKVDTSDRKVDTSDRKVDTSDRKVDTSDRKVDTSDRKVDTSDRKVDTSDRKVDTSNSYFKNSRLSREELELTIMKVCLIQYMKMEQVSIQVSKSVDYLKNKIFPKMIKDGKLEKHFPFTDNHPEQGYKTTEEYAKKL